MAQADQPFRPRCLSLDLEVDRRDGRIKAIAGIRADTEEVLRPRGEGLAEALRNLDRLADGAEFLLGHNLIEFDLPCLSAAKPDLRLLNLPVVDTLRLSPLAFPRNPYHRLVKHYQDGGLRRGQINDPELDSRLALDVFKDQLESLKEVTPDLLTAWHRLTVPAPAGADRALDDMFRQLRGSGRPSDHEFDLALRRLLDGAVCATQRREALADPTGHGWGLAYALAWLSVAGGNSVIPPWVRHQFPQAGRLVRRLRDLACVDPACSWCRERHDARKEMKRWFGFGEFRPEPATDDGRPMQQAIIEAAMAGKHVLGILPTGTGKSLCYQIPALSRYDKTGALTVVISPLVALMSDQVSGLEASGIGSCVTVNSLLSMPERADALDRVRLGDASMLLISPEQLRSRSLRSVLDQREIGAWVLDEAHCLSRWGHEFRPDYRYVSRFIGEKAGDGAVPPVLCLTATAKPDVVDDIKRHFHDRIGIDLAVFDGGAERTNLIFEVVPTSGGEKLAHIHQILTEYFPSDQPGGAIIYCATRNQSEEVAEFLQMKDVTAERFHAGLPPETKQDVQRRFLQGELRAIAATNAFGMGIDKPDVRLVIHADIPGTLENYLQEAGRAGRDQATARCVLLYSKDDVERQFSMSAYTRLNREEIHGILRALRNLNRKERFGAEVVATAGEILVEDDENAFKRDEHTDDTRVRTAIAWLEEAELLTREENFVQVFPSSLRVNSVKEAGEKLTRRDIGENYRRQLLKIAAMLIEANADEGVSTDQLMAGTGLSSDDVRAAMYDLEQVGIASNDTALTAFVHLGVEHSSKRRLGEANELERALIAHMREAAPDAGKGETSPLNLRIAAQTLRDENVPNPLPERLWRIIRGIAFDGRGEDGVGGSLSVRRPDRETVLVTLRRDWQQLEELAERRRVGAHHALRHLAGQLPRGSRGTDLLAETTLGQLLKAIESDLLLKATVRSASKLLDRALMWLHEQEVVRLNKGLAVFRPAMTIRLERRDARGFAGADFEPLALHYKGQTLQIHVMAEFAERGLADMGEAFRLVMDYFTMEEDRFLDRWLPGRDKEIGRETTPESWRAIVESLNNPFQRRIVADNRRHKPNVLVLAGPGSGKTRVLVHRIAYLVRARRENARSILALAYNRHAAVEIRRRLSELIGDDARGVTVLTCHALAMRLAGFSFTGGAERPDDEKFDEVIRRAVELLNGAGSPPEEADEQRVRLLAGFRWILVDEYQDIERDQYELISALAGRTRQEDDDKLTLFAVGDDDQNVYSFAGASVEFIRRFEKDYQATTEFLTGNYRSTAHIVAASNAMIEPARERMKVGRPIHVDRARASDRPGGEWEGLDPVGRGRVQIIPAGRSSVDQARTVMAELQRLAALAPDWDWSRCAVIAREWKHLDPVRAFCELHGIPSQMGNEEIPSFWQLRETRRFVEWLRARDPRVVDGAKLQGWFEEQATDTHWFRLLREAIGEHALETGGGDVPTASLIEWLAEWGREARRRQDGLLLLSGHRAKGLEFDHVAALDGGWDRVGHGEDPDAPRRLYYVAMTRARKTLALARLDGPHGLQEALRGNPSVVRRDPVELPPGSPALEYRYMRPGLEEVDLGFSGRRPVWSPVHAAIDNLSPGDFLRLNLLPDGRRELLNRADRTVGRMSSKFVPPARTRCRSASVRAVVGRRRDFSDPKYHDRIKCENWEVVVPELVFEPA